MKSIHDKNLSRMGDAYARDPNDCIIVGLDTDDGPEHSLYDGPSNARPVTEVGVQYAYDHGIEDVVFLVRDGANVLVLKGRKKTKEMREANKRRIANNLAPHKLRTIVVPGSHESDGMRLRRVVENWGLSYKRSTMEKLAEAKELLDHGQATPDMIAALLEIKPSRLNAHLALLSLGAKATAAINDGTLAPSAAAPLCGKSVKEQEELLAAIPTGKKPTLERVRGATGKDPVNTPKVRLGKAGTKLTLIAPVLAGYLAGLPDDDSIWADLSILAHELTGMTWSELCAGDSELDVLPA